MKIRPYYTMVPLLLSLILLLGCQATPQKTVVVNKGDNSLNQKIAASAAPEQKYNTPENYSDSFTSQTGIIQVNINAKVVTPDVTAYPVVSVVPDDITQQQADLFINTFMQGKTLYNSKTDADMTKSDIQQEILELKKVISDPDSDLNECKDSDPSGYEKSLEEYNQKIKDLEEKEKTAPDSYTAKTVTGKFEAAKISAEDVSVPKGGDSKARSDYLKSFQTINVFADLGKKQLSELYITKNTSNKANMMFFNNFKETQRDTILFENSADLPGMKTTLKQALDIANKTVSSLGLKSMQPALLGSAAYADSDHNGPLDQRQKYYFFIYTRTVQGIPTTYTDNNNQNTDQQYSESWDCECIKITVGDSGIQSFAWQSPEKTANILSANVKLLSFQDIMDKFKQQILISGTWNNDPNVINRKLNINKITLGMGRVERKDNTGAYMLIPEWDFFGTLTSKYKPGTGDKGQLDKNNEYTENITAHSYLTLNAIDGSVIDRAKGY